jgi:hypothetical protein
VQVVDPAPPEKEAANSLARTDKSSAKGSTAKASSGKTEAAAASGNKSSKAAQR